MSTIVRWSVLVVLAGCATARIAPDLASLRQRIAAERTAHYSRQPDSMAVLIDDSIVSVNRGVREVQSRSALRERFAGYFGRTDFVAWDDVTEPTIELSDDGSRAFVTHQKRVRTITPADSGGSREDETIFVWTEVWRPVRGRWVITAVTSTDRPGAVTGRRWPSRVKHRIPQPDLTPEGIGYDPVSRTLFVSSFRRGVIVTIDSQGTVADWRAPGLGSTAGIWVDAERRRIWVATGAAPHLVPEDRRGDTTRVIGFDLATRASVAQASLPVRGMGHIFNDFAPAPDGGVYVSGFGMGLVFHVAPGGALDTVATLAAGAMPNGLVRLADGSLVVSTGAGLVGVDPASGRWWEIPAPAHESLAGIDGLALHRDGSMIAVQGKAGLGRPGASRIARMWLDPAGRRISRIEALEDEHPLFDQPTTAVLAGDTLLYAANSQFPKYRDDFSLDSTNLREIRILALPVPPARRRP